MRFMLALLGLLVGCGPSIEVASDSRASSGGGDSTTDGDSGGGGGSCGRACAEGTTTTSGASTRGGSGTDGVVDEDGDGGFIIAVDGGSGSSWRCSLQAQDCPRGQKCMPYSSSRFGGYWDSTACFPVHPDPVGVGEVCAYDDEPWSGHDNCGWGAVCWDFGAEQAYCKGLCVDDQSWSPCEDPQALPNVGCQSCFCVCETPCDVLSNDCAPALMCVVTGELATCVPDASGEDGAFGDPCRFINACDPGLTCIAAEAVPGCEGATGCCSPYCDVTAPACPGGLMCEPYYPDGGAPPFLEDVGVCLGAR